MDKISEITKEQLKSKAAWIAAIALIPATIFIGYIYFIVSSVYFYFGEGFDAIGIGAFAAMTLFFAGVCLDMTAHIICCCKGSRAGAVMRAGAVLIELAGVMLFTLCLAVEASAFINWRNPLALADALISRAPTGLFLLSVIIWKAIEAATMIKYARCLSGKGCRKKVGSFGVAAVIAGVFFCGFLFLLNLSINGAIYSKSDGPLLGISTLMLMGFAAITVYIFALAVHSFKMRKRVNSYIE